MNAPEEAAADRPPRRAELPGGLEDLARRLEAAELAPLFFGAEHTRAARTNPRVPARPTPPPASARESWPSLAAWEWTESAGPADSVVHCRSALAGGGAHRGRRPDGVAALPLVLADLDEAGEVWNTPRGGAPNRFRAHDLDGPAVGRLHTSTCAASWDEAESEPLARSETLDLWGIPTQSQWPMAFLTESARRARAKSGRPAR